MVGVALLLKWEGSWLMVVRGNVRHVGHCLAGCGPLSLVMFFLGAGA